MRSEWVVDLKQLERRAFAYAFKVHIDGCETCSGPNDGCEVGQCMESLCIDLLDFDPYSLIVDMSEADTRKQTDE